MQQENSLTENHLTHKTVPVHGGEMTHDAKLSTGKRLQGAVDPRHRACRRTAALQMPGNAADAVPCEHLPIFYCKVRQ